MWPFRLDLRPDLRRNQQNQLRRGGENTVRHCLSQKIYIGYLRHANTPYISRSTHIILSNIRIPISISFRVSNSHYNGFIRAGGRFHVTFTRFVAHSNISFKWPTRSHNHINHPTVTYKDTPMYLGSTLGAGNEWLLVGRWVLRFLPVFGEYSIFSMSLHAFQPHLSRIKPTNIIINTCYGTMTQCLIVKCIPIIW